MTEEVVKVEVVVEGDQAGKKIKDLKKELKGTEQEAKKASESMKAISTEGISAKARLRALKDEMSSMADQGSPRFQELAAEAGKLKDQMNNANAAITTMSSDFPKLQVGIQAFQGIGAAAQFAAGAQLLFGDENKEVQKAMQRAMALTTMMTAVQQIANTVSDEAALGIKIRALNQKLLNRATLQQAVATGTATTAQKVMNAVMSANPIGIIITGIGLLVAGFIAFRKQIIDFISNWENLRLVLLGLLGPIGWIIIAYEKLFSEEAKLEKQRKIDQKERNKRHKEELAQIDETRDKRISASNDVIKALELEKDTLEANGKSSESITLQILEEELAKVQAVLDANRQKIDSYIKFYQTEAALRGQSDEEFAKSLKAQGIDLENLQQQANDLLEENERNVKLAENSITKFKREQAERRAKDVKKGADEEKKAREQALKAEEARIKREQKLFHDLMMEKEKLENEFLDSQLTQQQQELNAVEDKYFRLIELAQQYGEDTTILEEARLQALADVNEKFRLEEEERKAEADALLEEQRLERLELEQEAREQAIEDAFQSAESLLAIAESFNSLANSREIKRIKEKQKRGEKLTANEIKRLERQEKIQKAFALAQIAIDTARGISAAVAAGAGLIFPANIPAILAGVSAVLAGAAQAQQVLGESSSIDTGSIGDVGETAQSVTDNGQAPLRDITSGSTLLNEEPTQVVVLESDITSTQNNVAVIEAQATF